MQAGTAHGTHLGDGEAGTHLITIAAGTTHTTMVVITDIMDITEADTDTDFPMDITPDSVAAVRAAAQQATEAQPQDAQA